MVGRSAAFEEPGEYLDHEKKKLIQTKWKSNHISYNSHTHTHTKKTKHTHMYRSLTPRT